MLAGMALSSEDREWVRDEIGTAIPPTNGQLDASFDELGSRIAVAIRILKRRFAELAGGEVGAVNLAGVASVTLRSNLAALERQIARLQGELAVEAGDVDGVPGARVGRIHRTPWRS